MAGMDPNAAIMNAPPGTDPVDYAKLLKQQQLAQFLQSDALQQPQAPAPVPVRGLAVQARVSPVARLAKLAEALMASKATDQSNTGMAQAYARGLQQFSPGSGPPPAATPQSAAPGGAGANDAGQPGSTMAPPTQVSPMNPMGADPRALMQLYLTDKDKYLEMTKGTPAYQDAMAATGGNRNAAAAYMYVKGQQELMTPEYRKALALANNDPNVARQIMYAEAVKASSIESRPNNTTLLPLPLPGNTTSFTGPDPANGMQYQGDAVSGNLSAHPVPGADALVAGRAGAVTGAQQANTPRELTRSDGSTYLAAPQLASPGLTAPATPPLASLGQGNGAGPPSAAPAPSGAPRQYFPTSPGSAQTTAGKEFKTAGGKDSATYGSNLADDSNGATEVRRSLAEMRNLAKSNDPNALNSLKMKVASMAIAFGVDPATVQRSTGIDAGALEAAKKQTSGLAVASIHQMTSRGTNFDLETFMENNPNLMQTPGGYQRVLDYMDAKSKEIVDKHAAWDKFLRGEGRGLGEEQLKSAFTAKWNAKQNADIDAGKFTSRAPPEATATVGGVEHEKHGGVWYTADEWKAKGH